MPALPAVSKVCRVDFHHTFQGNANIQNRCYFEYTGALSQADAQTWVDAIATAWKNNAMLDLSSSLVLNSTVLTDLSSASAAQATSVVTGGGGGGAGAIASASLSVVVRKKLARRYRGGHPRDYLSGPPVAQLASAETWAAGFIANVATHYGAYISAALVAVPVAAAPALEVSVSYFSGFTNPAPIAGRRQRSLPTPRVTPLVDLVLSHSVNPRPASQRRRNLQSS